MRRILKHIKFGVLAYLVTNTLPLVWMSFVWTLSSGDRDKLSNLGNYDPLMIIVAYFFILMTFKYGYLSWMVGNIFLTIVLSLFKLKRENSALSIVPNLLLAYLVTSTLFLVWILFSGELSTIFYNPLEIIAAHFLNLTSLKYGYLIWIVGNVFLIIVLSLFKLKRDDIAWSLISNLGINILLMLLTPAIAVIFLVLIGFRSSL